MKELFTPKKQVIEPIEVDFDYLVNYCKAQCKEIDTLLRDEKPSGKTSVRIGTKVGCVIGFTSSHYKRTMVHFNTDHETGLPTLLEVYCDEELIFAYEFWKASKMNKFYFTFGTDWSYPFRGGWVIVKAETFDEACEHFSKVFPRTADGMLNCAEVYSEDEFVETDMYKLNKNLGAGLWAEL